MRQQISGQEQLRQTSLKDLGLFNGRAAIRYTTLKACEEQISDNTTVSDHNISNEMKSIEIVNTSSANEKTNESGRDDEIDKMEQFKEEISNSSFTGIEVNSKFVVDTKEEKDQLPILYPAHPISIFPSHEEEKEEQMVIETVTKEDSPIGLSKRRMVIFTL